MLNSSYRQFPQLPHAIHPLRTALALGCSALALIGCGGGSDDAPPPPPPAPTLAAPTNFTYEKPNFSWTATPGATRYELYVDPDGPGPLPESKQPDASADNGRKGFSFYAYPEGSQRFHGAFSDDNFSALGFATTINATYRLRACDAQGCGSFTAPIGQEYSYEFPSGRVPIFHSQSKDGLTLAINQSDYDKKIYEVAVYTRSNSAHPWQQQVVLRSGYIFFGNPLALSDDGNTLAIDEQVPAENNLTPSSARTYIYQRSGSTWSQQATLTPSNIPSACQQPCSTYASKLALSADGSLLAVQIQLRSDTPQYKTMGTVVIYARNGANWSQQALLETGDIHVDFMALARDGKTLAVNQGAIRLSESPPSFALVFTQQSNGTWSQQARIPVGLKTGIDITSMDSSDMKLSDDGNTLAVLAMNSRNDLSGRAVQAADLSCGPLSEDGYYMALFTRNGTAWQRQAAISRGYEYRSRWALARDGNALFYGNELFTRSNGVWVCP